MYDFFTNWNAGFDYLKRMRNKASPASQKLPTQQVMHSQFATVV